MKKKLKKVLIGIAVIFLLICLSAFVSSIHVSISRGGFLFNIGAGVVALGLNCFIMYLAHSSDDLSRYRREEKNNFILKFPKKPGPGDDVLARLAYDYGLNEYEIERIAKEGVHDAAEQYRQKRRLNYAPAQTSTNSSRKEVSDLWMTFNATNM